MKTYSVAIEAILTSSVEVEAESLEDAIAQVEKFLEAQQEEEVPITKILEKFDFQEIKVDEEVTREWEEEDRDTQEMA